VCFCFGRLVVVFLWWRAFGVGRGYWLGLALVGLVALGLGGFVSIVLSGVFCSYIWQK
jgi:hypothetical protein